MQRRTMFPFHLRRSRLLRNPWSTIRRTAYHQAELRYEKFNKSALSTVSRVKGESNLDGYSAVEDGYDANQE